MQYNIEKSVWSFMLETIIEKPWGSEEILELNEKYMLKRLKMNKGFRCSLQYHNRKCETIYVLSGSLKISHGQTKEMLVSEIYEAGGVITIKQGIIHRMEAVSDAVYLEASAPEIDDTVRIEDDFKRI